MYLEKKYFIPLIPLYCALAYILGIIYFTIITNYSAIVSVDEKIAFLALNYLPMFVIMNLIYVIFGIMIAFLSLIIYKLFKKSLFNKIGLIFGLFWSFAVIFAGILFTIGMGKVIEINIIDPNLSIITWTIIEIIFSSIGGGTEILGGLWILIISILAMKNNIFNKYINILGIVVGLSGILSHIPYLDFFQMVFGIFQIIWFFAIIYPLYINYTH